MEHSQNSPEQYWIMRTKPTPYWKHAVNMTWLKAIQLDSVERMGNTLRVGVQSGKVCEFIIGEFKAEYVRNGYGLRVFTIRSTAGPKRKIGFSENQLQMPQIWWDELQRRLGASEIGLSKVLHDVKDVLRVFK